MREKLFITLLIFLVLFIAALAFSDEVALTWDNPAVSDSGALSTKIYVKGGSDNEYSLLATVMEGKSTWTGILDYDPATKLTFYATANYNGLESDPSNTVSYTVTLDPPANLRGGEKTATGEADKED